MSEYLVRWKFGPNSLINHLDRDTQWFQQIHQTREVGVSHYISLLQSSSPSMAMTVQIFELVQLIPGEDDIPSKKKYSKPPNSRASREALKIRNQIILIKYQQGQGISDIAKDYGFSHEGIRKIIRSFDVKE